MKEKKRAVAYIRVSTNKEEQELSLENQEEFFGRYIVARGDELVNIYSDKGKSATKMQNRTELNRLMKAARAKTFDKLYVKDISRLFRNTLDFITISRELQELGIQLHLVNMGEGKDIDAFTLNLMAMIAENESLKMSERVKFGKKFSKERGIVPNFVFGYDRVDKFTLVPNPEESAWVQRIFDLYTEEKWGMARIAKYLYDNRVKTKKLKNGEPNYEWSQNTVSNVLKNRIYTGVVINGKQSTKNIYTNERVQNDEESWYVVERPEFRIISDEQFEKAQKTVVNNTEAYAPSLSSMRRSDKHLFSNLIKCGECGFSYRRIQRRYSENKPQKVYWTCSKRSSYGKDRCEAQYTRIEEAELQAALDSMFAYLIADKKAFFQMVEKKCADVIKEYIRQTADFDIDEAKERLEDLQEQRERLKTLAVKGLISMEEAERDMVPINLEMERLALAINRTDKTKEITEKVKESMRRFFGEFESFKFTDNIENADLKKIIKEIRVVSEEEIYVYFNVDDTLIGSNVPINLTELFWVRDKETDTDTENSTQRHHRPCGAYRP